MKTTSDKSKRLLGTVALIVITILFSGCGLFNNAPVISSLDAEKQWVELSGSCQVECVATDPDGDELTYLWTATDGSISGQGSTVTWNAPSTPGNHKITVIVSDGNGGKATMELLLLSLFNNPPVIESLTSEQEACLPDTPITIECIASDPEGEEITYQWTTTGGEILGEGSTVIWISHETPQVSETFTIEVTVTDERGGKTVGEVNIRVGRP